MARKNEKLFMSGFIKGMIIMFDLMGVGVLVAS
jgi:hypothetical protein